MRTVSALVLLLAACTSSQDATPPPLPVATPAPAETLAPPAPYVDVDAPTCRLVAEPAPAPALHPWLRAVAPQFFHPGRHRGGFDAYAGGEQFPWFDVDALDTPRLAPPGSRVVVATPALRILTDRAGQLGVVARGGGAPRWLGERLYPEDAGDAAAGVHWVLARAEASWQLVRIGDDVRVTDLGVLVTQHNVRLAVTGDGRVVIAWLERDGGTLRIRVRAEPDLKQIHTADEIDVDAALAERSVMSSVELALVADGPTGVAFAWRPLVGDGQPGSSDAIPTQPYDAEVRWRSVDRNMKPGEPRPGVPTAAPRWTGGSSLGPLGARLVGLAASRIGGRALFAWHGDGGVLGARVDHEAPTRLAPAATEAMIVLRPGSLLLLHSVAPAAAHTIRCR